MRSSTSLHPFICNIMSRLQVIQEFLEVIAQNNKLTEVEDIIRTYSSKLMGKLQDLAISLLGLAIGVLESSKQWPIVIYYDGDNSGVKKALDSNVFSVGVCQMFLDVITRILGNYNLCKGLPDFSLSSFLQQLQKPLAKSVDLNSAANNGCPKPIVSASVENSKLDSDFVKDQIGHEMTVACNFPSIRTAGWFHHLHVGPTVMFKPPADSDNSLAGFGFYFEYETHGHESGEIICNFYIDKDLQHTFVIKNMKGSEGGQRGQFVFVPRKCFDGKLKEATILEASVSTKSNMVVKRCRMHIISKQDTAKFATDLIQTAGEYLLKDSKVCPNCKQYL